MIQRPYVRIRPLFAIAILAGALNFAGSNGATGDMVDPIPSLTAASIDTVTLTLQWIAPRCQNFYGAYGPGPDGDYLHPAQSYELRYSTTPVGSTAAFATMTPATAVLPTPEMHDEVQACVVSGLTQGTAYWFLIKVVFHAAHDYSPICSLTTATDSVAPGTISDLSATTLEQDSITLAWTAPGDDDAAGVATAYELRYSMVGAIADPAGFIAATPVDLMPEPAAPGDRVTKTVPGLLPSTTYWFAIRAGDEVGNKGALPSTAMSATTRAAAVHSDGSDGGGCGASAVPTCAIALLPALLLCGMLVVRLSQA